jgi:hypothetical protein
VKSISLLQAIRDLVHQDPFLSLQTMPFPSTMPANGVFLTNRSASIADPSDASRRIKGAHAKK